MKKILLWVVLMTMGMSAVQAACEDGPYGLQINGSEVVEAPKFGDPDPDGRKQYKASCVDLKVGDEIKLINLSCDETWMINIDQYGSYQSFEGGKEAGKLTCKVAGKYDFYIKLSMEKGDLLYIGPGEDCGSTPGGGGGTVEGNPRYYYKGSVDGDDVEPSDETMFKHGKAAVTVYTEAYLFVLYQVDGYPGEQYMTDGWQGFEATHVKLIKNGNNKLFVGPGEHTLYLYDNKDGSLELSIEELPGKELVDPQPAGIEQTTFGEKARKVFIDGQLRIVRGDKIFDVTGRQLY